MGRVTFIPVYHARAALEIRNRVITFMRNEANKILLSGILTRYRITRKLHTIK